MRNQNGYGSSERTPASIGGSTFTSYDSKSCVLYSNGIGKAIIVAIGS